MLEIVANYQYAISRKTYDPNSRKWRKTSFRAWFRRIGPKFVAPICFFQKSSVTRCYGQQLLAVNYFRKKLHLKCLTGFWVRRCNNKVHGPWNCWSQSSAGKVFFRRNLVWNHFRNENEKSEKFTFSINQLQISCKKVY